MNRYENGMRNILPETPSQQLVTEMTGTLTAIVRGQITDAADVKAANASLESSAKVAIDNGYHDDLGNKISELMESKNPKTREIGVGLFAVVRDQTPTAEHGQLPQRLGLVPPKS